MQDTILVLDAMGVIYAAADDVDELLIPFVLEHGGISDRALIGQHYEQASLGRMDAAEFWKAVGLPPSLEDLYLLRHRLSDGLKTFLDDLPACVSSRWCLSNDISDWSRKLRAIHDLEDAFDGFVISGDVRVRKPDREIYEHLIELAGQPPDAVLFVDDRAKNLDTARSLGMRTIQFDPESKSHDDGVHPRIRSFSGLHEFCSRSLA